METRSGRLDDLLARTTIQRKKYLYKVKFCCNTLMEAQARRSIQRFINPSYMLTSVDLVFMYLDTIISEMRLFFRLLFGNIKVTTFHAKTYFQINRS